MVAIIEAYEVKKCVVRYACRKCNDRLTSEIADAGLEDRCEGTGPQHFDGIGDFT